MKTSGEVRLYIDFRNINKLLPQIDMIIYSIVGYEFLSFIDGLLGYNHIRINLDDMHKISFYTP